MHIHKTDLCSPTCGDPTYAETAAGVRKGGAGKEEERKPVKEDGGEELLPLILLL